MLKASILVIGDEILDAYVADQNAPWLAARLKEHSIPLSRIVVLPDDLAAIREALDHEMRRSRPRLILTCGGVGSTPDDITYEAIALTIGDELHEPSSLHDRIARKLEAARQKGMSIAPELSELLHQRARVPRSSRLLERPEGWLPVVAVDHDGGIDAGGVTIVVLPGSPSELQALTEQVVEPHFLANRNPAPTTVEVTHEFPEGLLSLALTNVAARYPAVKIGSYPAVPTTIRLSGMDAEAVRNAATEIERAIENLAHDAGSDEMVQAWLDQLGTTPSQD